MAQTPEELVNDPLLKAQMEAIKRQIEEQRARGISQAQGDAISRGLSGSTFEAARMSLADKASANAFSDAAVKLAVQQAAQQTEDRRILENRSFVEKESGLDRAQQYKMFQEQMNFERAMADAARKWDKKKSKLGLLGSAISAGGSAAGQIFGGF